MDGPELVREVEKADAVVDASDNFETRFEVNAACVAGGTPPRLRGGHPHGGPGRRLRSERPRVPLLPVRVRRYRRSGGAVRAGRGVRPGGGHRGDRPGRGGGQARRRRAAGPEAPAHAHRRPLDAGADRPGAARPRLPGLRRPPVSGRGRPRRRGAVVRELRPHPCSHPRPGAGAPVPLPGPPGLRRGSGGVRRPRARARGGRPAPGDDRGLRPHPSGRRPRAPLRAADRASGPGARQPLRDPAPGRARDGGGERRCLARGRRAARFPPSAGPAPGPSRSVEVPSHLPAGARDVPSRDALPALPGGGVLEGDQVDLGEWPVQTCWPEDAGPPHHLGPRHHPGAAGRPAEPRHLPPAGHRSEPGDHALARAPWGGARLSGVARGAAGGAVPGSRWPSGRTRRRPSPR